MVSPALGVIEYCSSHICQIIAYSYEIVIQFISYIYGTNNNPDISPLLGNPLVVVWW